MMARLFNSSSRRRRCVSTLVTIALGTIISLPAAAQDTTGVGGIAGVVVSEGGEPVEGVRVCALDTASCATSDARGAFRIGDLRAGAYRLEVLPLSGLPFASDPVDVRAGLDATVNITLPAVENFQQTVTVTGEVANAVTRYGDVSYTTFDLVDPKGSVLAVLVSQAPTCLQGNTCRVSGLFVAEKNMVLPEKIEQVSEGEYEEAGVLFHQHRTAGRGNGNRTYRNMFVPPPETSAH